eukprot:TRINITY_DN1440_c0_g1_i1.p1 TRINITY_DN1440_c0_g1~~TRINITY_DN1440_c0_g1_i1.p1  ORF type:complete len:355 (+),score=100.35 TRINITY_DN1440_c0_g1_i1:82-1065(+)
MSRTIFLAGLPDDATERELHLLFALTGGCDSLEIRLSASHGTVAYVQFGSEQRAFEMRAACNGLPYDPAEPQRLMRCEMATSNLTNVGPQMVAKRPLDHGLLSPVAAPLGHIGMLRGPTLPSAGPGGSGEPQAMRHPDGSLYTKAEWRDMYGGYKEWDAAVANATGLSTSRQPCKDFLNGRCDRGMGCRYYHGEDGEGRGLEMNIARNQVCKDFQNGRCDRGHSCRFAHVEKDGSSASRGGGGGNSSCTVHISGLGAEVTPEYVNQLCGAVDGFISASMRGQGQPAAHAYARFRTPDNAQRAVSVLQAHIGGWQGDGGASVRVQLAP